MKKYIIFAIAVLFLIVTILLSQNITGYISKENDIDSTYITSYFMLNKEAINAKNSQIFNNMVETTFTSKQNKITPEYINIRKTAYELTKNTNNDLERIKILFKYVSKIPYKESSELKYPLDTLTDNEGDCADKSVLLSSLLYNIGIENYVIETYPNDNFTTHSLNLVYVDKTWFLLDTTSEDFWNAENNNYLFKEAYNKEFHLINKRELSTNANL